MSEQTNAPTERDELAQIIDDRWHGYGYNPQGAAEAILAAGFRKPRMVTTVEELDALPVGSVVITKLSEVISKRHEPDGEFQSWWAMAGTSEYFQSKELPFPATVLHEGAPNV